MSFPNIESRQHSTEILTEQYHIKCVIEPPGELMTYIDSPEHNNFLIKNIVLTSLEIDSLIASVNIKELWIKRDEIILMRVNEDDVKGSLQNLPAKETLRIFMPRFVVQGTVLRGEDTRVGEMFDALIGNWAAVHEAQVYPLTKEKAQVFRQASLVLINKNRVRFDEAL